MKEYYYLDQNQQKGPFPLDQLKSHPIKKNTLVWTEGMRDWLPAGQVQEVAKALSVPTPPSVDPFASGGNLTVPNTDPFGAQSDFETPDVTHVAPTITARQVKNRFNAYAFSYFSAFALIFIGGISLIVMAAENAHDDTMAATAIGFFFPAFLAMIGALISSMSLLYPAWDNIQDNNPRTEPGKAVGFLFIPVFHYYWIFQAYRGLFEDMNEYMISRGYAKTQEMNVNIATAACVARVATIVLSYLALIPWLVLQFIMMVHLKNGLTLLIEKKEEATRGAKSW